MKDANINALPSNVHQGIEIKNFFHILEQTSHLPFFLFDATSFSVSFKSSLAKQMFSKWEEENGEGSPSFSIAKHDEKKWLEFTMSEDKNSCNISAFLQNDNSCIEVELDLTIFSKRKSGAPKYIFATVKTETPTLLKALNKFNLNNPRNKNTIVGSCMDVTNLKKTQNILEQKIEELEHAYEELDQFSYTVSHDLQEPLRKISTFGEKLSKNYSHLLGEDGSLFLNKILSSTDRMKGLIENILMLSRTKKSEELVEKVNLSITLDEVKNILEVSIAQSKMHITCHRPLPSILAIKFQMQQLFQNIISNAIKFSKHQANPTLQIEFKEVEADQIWILGLEPELKYLQISFKDNGIGFANKYYETIFFPLKKLHSVSEYTGTGIGLAICKKVIANHGGKIWAESEMGVGSTFYVVLPKSRDNTFIK